MRREYKIWIHIFQTFQLLNIYFHIPRIGRYQNSNLFPATMSPAIRPASDNKQDVAGVMPRGLQSFLSFYLTKFYIVSIFNNRFIYLLSLRRFYTYLGFIMLDQIGTSKSFSQQIPICKMVRMTMCKENSL